MLERGALLLSFAVIQRLQQKICIYFESSISLDEPCSDHSLDEPCSDQKCAGPVLNRIE